jgi:hypothetical protein
MSKNLQFLSIVYLGICIVLSSWLISQSLKEKVVESNEEKIIGKQDMYEFIQIANDYFIIFDKHSGFYWEKIGGSEWKKTNTFQN